jgi:hypothetical protein
MRGWRGIGSFGIRLFRLGLLWLGSGNVGGLFVDWRCDLSMLHVDCIYDDA